MLNSHSGHLCNKNAPESIGYSRVNADHVELHIEVVLGLDFDAKLVDPVTEIPSIVDIQQFVYVILLDCLSLQKIYLSSCSCPSNMH